MAALYGEDFASGVDFGRAAREYSRFRAGFPTAFFDRLASFGIGRADQRILDLGTGTGTLARGLARRGAAATGLDPSAPMLAESRRLDGDFDVRVMYTAGRAEALPFPGHSFDVVTAGQCWHWFDRPTAAAEARRVLEPGGSLVIAHFDWIPLAGNVVDRTEALIRYHNPDWQMSGTSGVFPQWLADVRNAGFVDPETFSFDVDQPYSHAAWRGRMQASAGVKASLSPEAARAFDADLARMLAAEFPADPLTILHRVWAVVARKPEET